MDPMRILCCDDEVEILEIFREELTDHGYQVDLAHDGEEAKSMVLKQSYDVIITDVWMPKINGFGLIAEVKKSKKNMRTPILMLSGLVTDEVEKAARMNLVEVIDKATGMPEIVKKLSEEIFPNIRMPDYDSRIVDCFFRSVEDTMKFYSDFQCGTAQTKKSLETSAYVTCSIGILGSVFKGNIFVEVDRVFINEFLKSVFGQETVEWDDESSTEYIGELGNQIAGALKREFESKEINSQITLPTCFLGSGKLISFTKNPGVLIPIRLGEGKASVRFQLSVIDKKYIKESADNVEPPTIYLWD